MRFLSILCLLATVAVGASAQLTVTVTGAGAPDTPGGPYSTLALAIAYVNANSSPPNTINIATNALGSYGVDLGHAGATISVPMTINGDGEAGGVGDGTRCVQYVDMNSAVAVAAPTGNYAFLYVATAGDVAVNNITLVPDRNGDATTSDTGAINLLGAAGTLNFSMSNALITAADTTSGNPKSASVSEYATAARFYNTSNGSGIHSQNTVGNTINVTLADVAITHTRYRLTQFLHQAGSVTINGGCIGSTGGDKGWCFSDNTSAVTVTIDGAPNDRVIAWNVKAGASAGEGFFFGTTAANATNVALVDCVDSISNGLEGMDVNESNITTVSNSRFAYNGDNATGQENWRIGSPNTYTVNISDCTFHDVYDANTQLVEFPTSWPGTANFTDCIFTGGIAGTGGVAGTEVIDLGDATGTYTFANCAIVTAGGNALAAGRFTGGTPNSETGTVSADPAYASGATNPADFNPANFENPTFLRPTNAAAYATAGSGGTPLVGGCPSTTGVPVELSVFSAN